MPHLRWAPSQNEQLLALVLFFMPKWTGNWAHLEQCLPKQQVDQN